MSKNFFKALLLVVAVSGCGGFVSARKGSHKKHEKQAGAPKRERKGCKGKRCGSRKKNQAPAAGQ